MNSLKQKSTRKIIGAVSTVLALAIGMLLNPPGMTSAQSSADLSSSSALSAGVSAKTAIPPTPPKRVFSAKESYIEYVVEELNAQADASSRGTQTGPSLSGEPTGPQGLAASTKFFETRGALTGLDIALLFTDSSDLADVDAKLTADGRFSSITQIDVNSVTPSLAALQAFDAVLVGSNFVFADSDSLGNVLADYVDGGGGVVTTMAALMDINFFGDPYSLVGRFRTDDYFAISYVTGNQTHPSPSLGTVNDPSHPVMAGVSTLTLGASGALSPATTVGPLATNVAEWSTGEVMVAVRDDLGAPRVDLNFYAMSTDLCVCGWTVGTDGALMIANALEYVAEGNLIFNGGDPDQLSAVEMTNYEEADDFTLSKRSVIASVRFWTLESGVWDGSTQYAIYQDSAGSPGSVVASGSVMVSRTLTGLTGAVSLTEYLNEFDLPSPITLDPGTYWLGLHMSADCVTNDGVFWETTSSTIGALSRFNLNCLGTWATANNRLAFKLFSEPLSIIYVASSDDGLINFGELNRNTGLFSAIGTTGPTYWVHGMAYDSNSDTVYATVATSNGAGVNTLLRTVDQASGVVTDIGANSAQIEGLAYDPNAKLLYGIDQLEDQLYLINTVTGLASPIGSPPGTVSTGALAFDTLTNTLYGINDGPSELVIINTTTGVQTTIGALGGGINDVDGLTYSQADGFLYGINSSTEETLRIDPATGAATVVAGTGTTWGLVFGMTSKFRPGNDECSTPVCLGDGDTFIGSNAFATGSNITSCEVNDTLDVWFTYTPTSSGFVTIDTNGSTVDTTLALFDSCGGSELACDDNGGTGLNSLISQSLVQNQTYYIRVAGYNGSSGDFVLNITGGLGERCDLDVVWTDSSYGGAERGTFSRPFDGMADALTSVNSGGTLRVKSNDSFTGTINQDVRIESIGGSIVIGQ